MARVSQIVCDRCGGSPAPNGLRLSSASNSKTADLCDGCADELVSNVPGLRVGAKRGRKAKAEA